MFDTSKRRREKGEASQLEEWLEETCKSGRVRRGHSKGCSWILTAVGAIEGFRSPDGKCLIDPYAPPCVHYNMKWRLFYCIKIKFGLFADIFRVYLKE